VRDGFIAWELNPSVDGFGGMNSLFFHQWILARRIRRTPGAAILSGLRSCKPVA
jgi:hypothetical protein